MVLKPDTNMVDINNDGYLDIFICKSGYKDPNLRKKILYINNKNNTFTNRAAELWAGRMQATACNAYFFDYDNDGDKDVYFCKSPHRF